MLLDITKEQAGQPGLKVLLVVVNNDYDMGLLSNVSRLVKVVRINRKPGSKNLRNLLALARLNILFLLYRPVVIHCHNQKLIDVLFFKALKNKAVITAHTTGLSFSLLSKYRKCFAISTGVKTDILSKGALPLEVIYNGVQVDGLHVENRAEKKEQAEGPAGVKNPEATDLGNAQGQRAAPFRIVQIGRLDHLHKGQDLLLKAVATLNESGRKNIYIDFFGDGTSRSFLEALSRQMGLTENVRFRGSVPRNEIYEKLWQYELLVQPSNWEGFGLSIVEAMMAEVPVLVSDLPAPMEIIAQGDYGLYFKVGDKDDLKDKLLWALTHYQNDAMQQKIRAAAHYAKTTFDVRQTAMHYLQAYKNLRSS